MSSIFGKNIKISIFGESHGKMLGVTINGLKAGLEIDLEFLKEEINRRKPVGVLGTPRYEEDDFEIVSGFFEGCTTGSPLTIVCYNKNTISKHYNKDILRPSHADYTANVKYYGFQDYRGGGHFSGRITLLIVIAGAICKQALSKYQINIKSHIKNIGNVYDDKVNESDLDSLDNSKPTLNDCKFEEMKDVIVKAKEDMDSVGGSIEVFATGVFAGLGDPFFDSVESILSHLFFSIPAVKSVEFGLGIDFTSSYGSLVNDSFETCKGKIITTTNNNGGINGGITNGMPVVATIGFKPTPSIGKVQKTVDLSTFSNVDYQINGRHDPCVVVRARVVVEAMMAIGLLDLVMDGEEYYD